MKAIILAGGFGTRLSEETEVKPKPMVEIGGKPILWHIMNIYGSQGVKEFIIALGYKGEVIKEYFLNYYSINNDISVDLETGETTIHDGNQPDWTVHLVDTGLYTQTGGRLKRLGDWLEDGEVFHFTYGDGVADIDLEALQDFHDSHDKIASVTTVRTPGRFGRIHFDEDRVEEFYEKPDKAQGWINGGFFVLDTRALEYIDGDDSSWEREPIERLAADGEMMGYRHYGFWSCMDTLREKRMLEAMWEEGEAPWRVWDESGEPPPVHRQPVPDPSKDEEMARSRIGSAL